MLFVLALVAVEITQVYAATSSKQEICGNVMSLFDVDANCFGCYEEIISSFCKGLILKKDGKLFVI